MNIGENQELLYVERLDEAEAPPEPDPVEPLEAETRK